MAIRNKESKVPLLVILETHVLQFIPQTERVQKAIDDKINRAKKEKARLLSLEIECKTSELLRLKGELKG